MTHYEEPMKELPMRFLIGLLSALRLTWPGYSYHPSAMSSRMDALFSRLDQGTRYELCATEKDLFEVGLQFYITTYASDGWVYFKISEKAAEKQLDKICRDELWTPYGGPFSRDSFLQLARAISGERGSHVEP